MSEAIIPTAPGSMPDPTRSTPDRSISTPRRTWLGEAMGRTWHRVGARIGFTWIALVAMVAVMAPFIANSRPYLMKTAEGWSSPLLGGLSAVDVLLLVLFAAVVVTLL